MSERILIVDDEADFLEVMAERMTHRGVHVATAPSAQEALRQVEAGSFDAVILDIPLPWDEVQVVKQALKSGGRLVSLNPTFNQIEKMAEALREQGFILVEARELLEREILARGGKTRPVQRMVGHTEFMLFAVWPAPLETSPKDLGTGQSGS
jgi:tRNA (adenine57-N1/adenine58-N1)-methyltransferase